MNGRCDVECDRPVTHDYTLVRIADGEILAKGEICRDHGNAAADHNPERFKQLEGDKAEELAPMFTDEGNQLRGRRRDRNLELERQDQRSTLERDFGRDL